MKARKASPWAAAQRGFTLIELMVVVAIIGVLAAIAMPAYQDYTRRSYVAEGLTLASTAKNSIEDYYAANNAYPANNASAGLASSSVITGAAVSSVEVVNGVIVVTFNSKVSAGATLIFVPGLTSGAVTWSCTSGTVARQYVPATCR